MDHALSAEGAQVGEAFACGNSTALMRTQTGVRAESLYDLFEPQEMLMDDFLAGLKVWRYAVA